MTSELLTQQPTKHFHKTTSNGFLPSNLQHVVTVALIVGRNGTTLRGTVMTHKSGTCVYLSFPNRHITLLTIHLLQHKPKFVFSTKKYFNTRTQD